MSDSPETRPSLLVRLRDPPDEQAWGEFVEIYEPLVYRLARRRGFQDADARELVQDVLGYRGICDRTLEPRPNQGLFSRLAVYRCAKPDDQFPDEEKSPTDCDR